MYFRIWKKKIIRYDSQQIICHENKKDATEKTQQYFTHKTPLSFDAIPEITP